MKLKLLTHESGFLVFNTTAEEKEYDLSEDDLIDFQSGFLSLKLEDLVLVKYLNQELKDEVLLEKSKIGKKEAIGKIASLTDQLNLLGAVCYKLTEGSIDPEILLARKAYEDIQLILNK